MRKLFWTIRYWFTKRGSVERDLFWLHRANECGFKEHDLRAWCVRKYQRQSKNQLTVEG